MSSDGVRFGAGGFYGRRKVPFLEVARRNKADTYPISWPQWCMRYPEVNAWEGGGRRGVCSRKLGVPTVRKNKGSWEKEEFREVEDTGGPAAIYLAGAQRRAGAGEKQTTEP